MKISQSLRKFAADESGVTAIEYGILAAAMAAAVGYIFSSDGAFKIGRASCRERVFVPV